jgi:hypothetical protein
MKVALLTQCQCAYNFRSLGNLRRELEMMALACVVGLTMTLYADPRNITGQFKL